jgi:hypothetical protein
MGNSGQKATKPILAVRMNVKAKPRPHRKSPTRVKARYMLNCLGFSTYPQRTQTWWQARSTLPLSIIPGGFEVEARNKDGEEGESME